MVINYYNRNNSNVYCVLLDASKAFDRIEFCVLFKLLIEKNMCPMIARFLAYLYTNQTSNCKWGNNLSRLFDVSNGVKQGGVLSPKLFNVYLYRLLNELQNSGYGCYIGNTFMGSFCYADDVTILSPSVEGVCKMLDICESFSVKYDLKFNVSKSKLLCFGQSPGKPVIHFQGEILSITDNEKHLGHIIGTNSEEQSISNGISDMFYRLNVILREFKHCDVSLIYYLFKTYCMSVYGSVLWNFENIDIQRFFTAWRKAVRSIFNLPFKTHCYLLPYICNDTNVDVQLHKRFLKL